MTAFSLDIITTDPLQVCPSRHRRSDRASRVVL